MSWEQRLRDLVLAGGALAAIGCADNGGTGVESGSVNFCCNANGDPCCPSLYCGAAVTTECTVKMACESDGETWNEGTHACGHPKDAPPIADAGSTDAQPDAGPTADAGSTDAQPDVSVGPFCCNANADPCCPSLYCGKTATLECTDKMACESSGGMWEYPGCTLDAGTRDATSDAP